MNNDKQQKFTGKRLRQSSLLESFNFLKKKRQSCDSTIQQSEETKIMSGEKTEIEQSAVKLNSARNISETDTINKTNKTLDIENGRENPSCSKSNIDMICDIDLEKCNSSYLSDDIFEDTPDDTNPRSGSSQSNKNSINFYSRQNCEPDQDSVTNLNINRSPFCCKPLPKLWSTSEHSVLFNCNISIGSSIRPFPVEYKDAWDSKHVRLPCSVANMYPTRNSDTGDEEITPRWEMIEKSLLSPITSSFDLQEAIMSYNSQYINRWNFRDLHKFFTNVFEPEETNAFFSDLMPKMIKLALSLPQCCTSPIPLLRKNYIQSVTISQLQIGCLLANAFFCTFPRRNSKNRNSEYSSYPDINFNKLFTHSDLEFRFEKLKCIFNYFKRITSQEPVGVLTFDRRHSKFTPCWNSSKRKLNQLFMLSRGRIESEGVGLLQVDFANKFVGGGVLGHGCVQEEIRFLICPELIISKLFTESLNENEVLIITGCEQYNSYSGYSNSFKWEGDYQDKTPRDAWGRRYTQVLAMDAIHFSTNKIQYEPKNIQRELNKAFSGFYEASSKENLTAIATGNWGCGAFNGDPRLKVLIQLLAASESDRDLVYFTFGDDELKSDSEALFDFLLNKDSTVSDVYKLLLDYCKYIKDESSPKSLYSYFYDHDGEISDSTLDLDSEELKDLLLDHTP